MAAIIETATRKIESVEIDAYEDVDGFTSGDAQIGKAATQVSAKFFDAVTAELGRAIRGIHSQASPPALDPDDWGQLRDAINNRFVSNYPKSDPMVALTFEWRSQWHENSAAAEWKERRRSDRKENVVDNAAYKLCNFTPPDLSQGLVTYVVTMVGTNDLSTRALVEIKASVKRNGGTVTVQSSATVFDDSPDATVTVAVFAGQVYCDVAVAIIGENVNIFVTGTYTTLTQDT